MRSLAALLIPERIAPLPADTERLRSEALIFMCDYWEWYVAVRVTRVNELVRLGELSYARVLTNTYGSVRYRHEEEHLSSPGGHE